MRIVLTFLAFVLAVCLTACAPDQSAQQLLDMGLTKDELVYLAAHQTIRYVAETSHAPYAFEQSGKPQGLSMDYLELVAKKLGLKLEPVKFNTFAEGLDAIRDRSVLLMPTVRRTTTRETYLAFSSPYALVGGVIVYRDALHPATVGVAKNFAIKEWVLKEMASSTLVEFPNDSVCITNLSRGTVDSCAMDLASYQWLKPLSDYPLVVKAIGFDYPYNFVALKDNKDLTEIISKALALITPKERAEISARWIKVDSSTADLR